MIDESIVLAEEASAGYDIGALMGDRIHKAEQAANKRIASAYYEAEFVNRTPAEKIVDDIPESVNMTPDGAAA